MLEPNRQSSGGKNVSDALVWRLVQIVLVLAAAYLYFDVGSYGALLQQERLFQNPHTGYLLRLIATGLLIGIFLGLATKDFSSGRIGFSLDWPTLLINLVAAGAFMAVAVSLNISAVKNTEFIRGAIKNAVVVSPLLPFVWAGLALTTIVKSKPAQVPPPAAPPALPAEDDPGVMAP